jgi:putative ABC transport system permease protein
MWLDHLRTAALVIHIYRTEGSQVFMVLPQANNESAPPLPPYETLQRRPLLGIQSVLPRVTTSGTATSAGRRERLSVLGSDAALFRLYRLEFLEGRGFLPEEVEERRPVCVLTEHAARGLFPLGKAVGQSLDLHGRLFHVIGVIHWERALEMRLVMSGSPDAFVPFAWLPFSGAEPSRPEPAPLVAYEVRLDPRMTDTAAEEAIERFFLGERNPDLLRVMALEDFFSGNRETSDRLMRQLLAIAAVTLVVGMIGVVNVMLISVTERTQEIGVRKALGARPRDIRTYFLVESSALCLTGGVAAAGIGCLGIFILQKAVGAEFPLAIPPAAVFECLLATAGIGLIAGLYPASRAANLSAIEALRHE